MDNIIDARNLSCPQPVILTKQAMEKQPNINLITIVSEQVAKENVSKLAASQGYTVDIEEKDEGIYLHLNKTNGDISLEAAKGELAILLTSQFYGKGNDELGKVLMTSFLYTLTEMSERIENLILMNSAVYLACEDSSVLEHLAILQEDGVEILSCGTCLDFYELKDKLKVGNITNMYTAMDILASAKNNITF
ncbi:MAG TPA: sulfurtransferase-like selenium metabolism protein YedF [Syntrophomonadaceae bacterium]|nr:sulfurtransferase-like selenium metabolism protein YedF [Syntrophomonadaceae bacterium]